MLISSAEEEYAIEETDSDFDDGETDVAYVRERRDLAAAESGIGGTGGGAGAGYKAGKVIIVNNFFSASPFPLFGKLIIIK